MFKVFWKNDWFAMTLSGFQLKRFAARDFKGYPVPIFIIDQNTFEQCDVITTTEIMEL